MERFPRLLLDVWREACRHIEIEESAPTLVHILSRRLPITGLLVDAFDWERHLIQPRARATVGEARSRLPASRGLSREEGGELRRWFEGRRVTALRAGAPPAPELAALVGDFREAHWIVAPLASDHGAAGAVTLEYREIAEEDELVRAMGHLVEPFSVALENDRRLVELRALREASEAERRAVLARLGRDDLIETIIGEDSGLRSVIRRATLVAGSDVPVLILGETGSGKEVMARLIHEQSPRLVGPFIRVNCGAIPTELVDSELFGHERGAFTGATGTRRGWFERADGGTLLLDEIGELPLPAQVRLLRVLQEGIFERVGGERLIQVDVRIVAATHRDLPLMVRQGRFREDLWYRIAGFPVLIPPLRERREDIPALARHFAERAARRFGLRPLSLTPADIDLLAGYSWPGNIRELATVIDRAAILGAGETLEIAKALGGNVAPDLPEASARTAEPGRAEVGTLDDVVRGHIESALRAARGRIEGPAGVARVLGVNPHTLRARMRKLGIDWSRHRGVEEPRGTPG